MTKNDWDNFSKSVAPLPKKARVKPLTIMEKPKKTQPETQQENAPEWRNAGGVISEIPMLGNMGGLSKQKQRQMARGQFVYEAMLDLHGMRHDTAENAFRQCILRKDGKRNLLIITGKGAENKGVLKTALPRWCEQPALAARILCLACAHPSHGGTGAYYIVLRKG